jgi:cellulose synthase/poly-beta-1,6-N-acetylglucosamine synthase-like glycosyltransferase
MLTLHLIYFFLTLFIWWNICGYTEIIAFLSIFAKRSPVRHFSQKECPPLTILVPCYNEEALVNKKFNNVIRLQYPKEKFKVVFIDGRSNDKTYDKLKKLTKLEKNISVIRSPQTGKIQQLNWALKKVNTDIIINTDMDTMLDKNVLKEIVIEFQKDPNVGVVGAYVMPKNSASIDFEYWLHQNEFRVLESKIVSASIVVAPCYAFKREILTDFPEDCVADDIYLAFLANVKGREVKFIREAKATEIRAPHNLRELFVHKFRKSNAYLIELLRFLYKLPMMNGFWKIIYLTKLSQLLIFPWALLLYGLMSVNLLFININNLYNFIFYKTFQIEWLLTPGFQAVIFSFLFMFFNMLITRYLLVVNRRKLFQEKKYRKRSSITVFLITFIILIITGITYPFYRQNSSYHKI